jgi:hypothetical protein
MKLSDMLWGFGSGPCHAGPEGIYTLVFCSRGQGMLSTARGPVPPPCTQFFLFDLETVRVLESAERLAPGTIAPAEHRVWDIAVLHVPTRQCWSSRVDPGLEAFRPPPPGHPQVTPESLRAGGARPFAAAAREFLAFLAQHSAGGTVPVVLASHGGFVLDKPVLEAELRRAGFVLPAQTFFFDTYPFFRAVFGHCAPDGFSLSALYASAMGHPRVSGLEHSAIADVLALEELLVHSTRGSRDLARALRGGYYAPNDTPLQTIRGIGDCTEALMWAQGLRRVEDLVVQGPALETVLGNACGLSPPVAARIAAAVGAYINTNRAMAAGTPSSP